VGRHARSLPQAKEKAINDCGTLNTLQIWNELPQKPVAKAAQNFRKRSQASVNKAGGHFEHFI